MWHENRNPHLLPFSDSFFFLYICRTSSKQLKHTRICFQHPDIAKKLEVLIKRKNKETLRIWSISPFIYRFLNFPPFRSLSTIRLFSFPEVHQENKSTTLRLTEFYVHINIVTVLNLHAEDFSKHLPVPPHRFHHC